MMQNVETIVCLVGEQPIPNAIPVKHLGGTVRKVELICTNKTKSVSGNLGKWLKTQGVEVIENCVKDDRKVNDLREQARIVTEILENNDKEKTVVNLTGGTKIMALAAAAVCSKLKVRSIYVDTQNKLFWQVQPMTQEETLTAKFEASDIVSLHGQEWNCGGEPSEEEKTVARLIARNTRTLIGLVENLRKTGNSQTPLKSFTPATEHESFLNACIKADILQRHKTSGEFSWGSRRLFFQNNDWLECLVFCACKDAGFDDVRWKVKVDGGKTTDLDVVATLGESLVVCSCKAGDFLNAHLNEIESHAEHLAGRFSKRALVIRDANKFGKSERSTRDSRAALEERAAKCGIRVFYSTDFADLGAKLKQLFD